MTINNTSICFNKFFVFFLVLLFPFSLFAQIEGAVLFSGNETDFLSTKTYSNISSNYVYAANLISNEGSAFSNIELFKLSNDLRKIDSVSLENQFDSHDFIITGSNDSIIIFAMRRFINDEFPALEVIIYDEELNLLNSKSISLTDLLGKQTRKFYLVEDDEGGFMLYATVVDPIDLWFCSIRFNSDFVLLESNKQSIPKVVRYTSNIVKFEEDYYFTALQLYRSKDGFKDWSVVDVQINDKVFYNPSQIMHFNNHLLIASRFATVMYGGGLLVEFFNNEFEDEKSKYYFEQSEHFVNLSDISNYNAIAKNHTGDKVIISGQLGSILGYPNSQTPTNLYFIQYDDELNETWIKILEGNDFYFMYDGIRYMNDEKIIGSGFKYAIEEDKFYGFIIMLDSETGDIISNVNTHSISPERLKLFPNPVSEHLNIELPASDLIDYENYSIMTVQGAVLKQNTMTGTTISVGDLPIGQYVLLLHGSGKVAVGEVCENVVYFGFWVLSSGFWFDLQVKTINNEMLTNIVLNSETINTKGLEGLEGLVSCSNKQQSDEQQSAKQ